MRRKGQKKESEREKRELKRIRICPFSYTFCLSLLFSSESSSRQSHQAFRLPPLSFPSMDTICIYRDSLFLFFYRKRRESTRKELSSFIDYSLLFSVLLLLSPSLSPFQWAHVRVRSRDTLRWTLPLLPPPPQQLWRELPGLTPSRETPPTPSPSLHPIRIGSR